MVGVEYNLSPAFSPAGLLVSLPATPPDPATAPARAAAEARSGEILYRRGMYRDAYARFKSAAELQPLNADHHYQMACAAWLGGDFANVESSLLEAAYLEPHHPAVQESLALWFVRQGDITQALDHSALALATHPCNPDYIITRAEILAADGQIAAAWQVIEPLVASHAPTVQFVRALSAIAPKIERLPLAIDLAQRAIIAPGATQRDRSQVLFILANLLEQAGRYDEAFTHARLANELGRRPFDPQAHSADIYARIGYYSRRRMRSLPRATHGDSRPVFIVGMPRSGTTLVEQILASHHDVHGAGELSRLTEIIRGATQAPWSAGQPFPDCWDNLSVRNANELAGQYLATINALSRSATYVTDKMPLHYLFLGTIQILFPDSKIIHCVRDPRDTCLSCYFTDFAAQNEFSFDLGHLANYYRDYVRLMDHWKLVLKLPILEVRYEQLVGDFESQARRMLDFLELPWDESCARFFQNRRPVSSASRDQVRRPLYASSVGRWRHYQKHMAALTPLLQEAGYA